MISLWVSCSNCLGSQTTNYLKAPSMPRHIVERLLEERDDYPTQHDITRAWFLQRCKSPPLHFSVFRRYGGDRVVDEFITMISSSWASRSARSRVKILSSIHYSIHRFMVRPFEPPKILGVSLRDQRFGALRFHFIRFSLRCRYLTTSFYSYYYYLKGILPPPW